VSLKNSHLAGELVSTTNVTHRLEGKIDGLSNIVAKAIEPKGQTIYDHHLIVPLNVTNSAGVDHCIEPLKLTLQTGWTKYHVRAVFDVRSSNEVLTHFWLKTSKAVEWGKGIATHPNGSYKISGSGGNSNPAIGQHKEYTAFVDIDFVVYHPETELTLHLQQIGSSNKTDVRLTTGTQLTVMKVKDMP
jgi:hypothetical protein